LHSPIFFTALESSQAADGGLGSLKSQPGIQSSSQPSFEQTLLNFTKNPSNHHFLPLSSRFQSYREPTKNSFAATRLQFHRKGRIGWDSKNRVQAKSERSDPLQVAPVQ
jgi:hypothetical protein